MSLDVDPSKRPALAHWSKVADGYVLFGVGAHRYCTLLWDDGDGWLLRRGQHEDIVLDVVDDAGSVPFAAAIERLVEERVELACHHQELAAYHSKIADVLRNTQKAV